MKKISLLIVFVLFRTAFCAAGEYGSADFNLMVRFHPLSLFFYLEDMKIWLSPAVLNKRPGGYDADNFFVIRGKLYQKILDENHRLLMRQQEIHQQSRMLQAQISAGFEMYKISQNASSNDPEAVRKIDQEYLKQKAEQENEIKKLSQEDISLKNELKKLFFASEEETEKIYNTVVNDIKNAVKKITSEKKLEGILLFPGIKNDYQEIRKADLKIILASDKKTFSLRDAGFLEAGITQSLKALPDFVTGRKSFIVCGGIDLTEEIIRILHEKYAVKKDFTDTVISKIGGMQ